MAYTTINKSTDYFNTKLYSGTGSSQNITGVGHQPDLTWIKSRSTTHEHKLIDAIRGVTKALASDNTTAEFIDVQGLTAFGSDGFSIGTDSYYNTNGHNYASWNWKANGTGVANTDGYIASTVSVNTTSGFSIVSYTGNGSAYTVGHGLGSAPGLIILKNLTTNRNWQILHHKNTSAPATQQLEFGLDGTATVTSQWNSVMPTASVFTIGTNDSTNKNGDSFIAYCFAEKQGYSKFGSYIGNGNADGTFVYTGFKPAWIMFKRTDYEPYNWYMLDSKRQGFNSANETLSPNTNSAASSTGLSVNTLDFLSNGFKMRTNNAEFNSSGATYIYMSFAEAPLVGTNNVPANAR